MQINGAEQQRGHVLLIAGDRAVHRRTVQVQPSANLDALSVVPVPVLLNSMVPTDLVHLDGVPQQNTLLLRLRTAAATPGPLLVYLSGRLTVDRKGRRLHLATAATTSLNARYTALPWEWVQNELRTRPAGWTTLLVDLVADKAAWTELQELDGLPPVSGTAVYGVVSPPGFGGTDGASPYTHHLIEQLRRSPERPNAARLHALTVAASALPPGALVIPAAPQIAPAQPVTAVQRLLAGDTSFLSRRSRPAPEDVEVAPGLEARPPAPPVAAPVPVQAPQPPVPAPTAPPAPVHPPVSDHRQSAEQPYEPVRAPHPAPAPTAPPAPLPAVPAPRPESVRPAASAPVQPLPQQPVDPRQHIWETAQAGRHSAAAEMAAAWEQHALQTYGPDSPQATQWAEIRADLARIASRWTYATQLWIAATRTRLAHQSPDAPEVLTGATSAHYCWTQIQNPAEARECGPELINLLRKLPSLDRRQLASAQQRLEYLQHTPAR
ncbi:hypothetical protein ACFQ7A_04745 [Streptomyces sp. NPDC056528]|uniref:hypothetical protein n=1 Tax=Streptomyces sp. NPDC056528 TaxID=3345854 RepID=UPI0036A50970